MAACKGILRGDRLQGGAVGIAVRSAQLQCSQSSHWRWRWRFLPRAPWPTRSCTGIRAADAPNDQKMRRAMVVAGANAHRGGAALNEVWELGYRPKSGSKVTVNPKNERCQRF